MVACQKVCIHLPVWWLRPYTAARPHPRSPEPSSSPTGDIRSGQSPLTQNGTYIYIYTSISKDNSKRSSRHLTLNVTYTAQYQKTTAKGLPGKGTHLAVPYATHQSTGK